MKYALPRLIIAAMHKLAIGSAFAAVAGAALADVAPLDKQEFEAAEARIEQQHKAERQACRRHRSQARDICEAEADGREKVAKAQLEARLQPGPELERQVKDARAQADFEVAKEKCRLVKAAARDACLEQARAVREAALRLAKVEKVERINELKAQARQRQPADGRGS